MKRFTLLEQNYSRGGILTYFEDTLKIPDSIYVGLGTLGLVARQGKKSYLWADYLIITPTLLLLGRCGKSKAWDRPRSICIYR
jgi:hypothetical protein